MKQLLAGLFTLLFALRGVEATFEAVFPSNGGDPNAFSLTNILECAVDHGVPFNVPLVIPFNGTDHDYWLPEVSGYVNI